jgi:hypothetical protein
VSVICTLQKRKWKKTKKDFELERNGDWIGVERGVVGFSVQNVRS